MVCERCNDTGLVRFRPNQGPEWARDEVLVYCECPLGEQEERREYEAHNDPTPPAAYQGKSDAEQRRGFTSP